MRSAPRAVRHSRTGAFSAPPGLGALILDRGGSDWPLGDQAMTAEVLRCSFFATPLEDQRFARIGGFGVFLLEARILERGRSDWPSGRMML